MATLQTAKQFVAHALDSAVWLTGGAPICILNYIYIYTQHSATWLHKDAHQCCLDRLPRADWRSAKRLQVGTETINWLMAHSYSGAVLPISDPWPTIRAARWGARNVEWGQILDEIEISVKPLWPTHFYYYYYYYFIRFKSIKRK